MGAFGVGVAVIRVKVLIGLYRGTGTGMSHCGSGGSNDEPTNDDSSDTSCNDATCTQDLCSDGEGRRQVGADCCSCESARKASSAVSESALLVLLVWQAALLLG
jgi:hypothetical protein